MRREVTTRNWFIVHGVVRCNFISGVSRIIFAWFLALQVSPYEMQHVKFFFPNLLTLYLDGIDLLPSVQLSQAPGQETAEEIPSEIVITLRLKEKAAAKEDSQRG